MFKSAALVVLALSASLAFAHGSKVEQAQEAITATLETIKVDESRERLAMFESVEATLVAHETFNVVVGYSDRQSFQYVCKEDESVEPPVWNCHR